MSFYSNYFITYTHILYETNLVLLNFKYNCSKIPKLLYTSTEGNSLKHKFSSLRGCHMAKVTRRHKSGRWAPEYKVFSTIA